MPCSMQLAQSLPAHLQAQCFGQLQDESSASKVYSVEQLRHLATHYDVVCLPDWGTIKLPSEPQPIVWERMQLAMEPSKQFRVRW